MAAVELIEFLRLLAAYVAARADLVYGGVTPAPALPWSLWTLQFAEDQSTPTRTVMRPYDGELGYVPRPRAAVQFKTTGPDAASALAQNQAVFNALLDAGGRPLRRLDLPTSGAASHRLIGVHVLQGPGLLGVDERDRPEAVFNADLDYVTL